MTSSRENLPAAVRLNLRRLLDVDRGHATPTVPSARSGTPPPLGWSLCPSKLCSRSLVPEERERETVSLHIRDSTLAAVIEAAGRRCSCALDRCGAPLTALNPDPETCPSRLLLWSLS
jgi:hypothetical protein